MRFALPSLSFGLFDSAEPAAPAKSKLPGGFDASEDELPSLPTSSRPPSVVPSQPNSSVVSSSTDPLSRHILKRTGTELNVGGGSSSNGGGGGPGGVVSEFSRMASFTPGDDRVALSRPQSNVSRRMSRQETNSKDKPPSLPSILSTSSRGQHKRHVSFFSRFRKAHGNSNSASDSGSGSGSEDDQGGRHQSIRRAEGNNATLFSSTATEYYVPQTPEPPRYIRVRAHAKMTKDFDRLFLAQELHRKPGQTMPNTPATPNFPADQMEVHPAYSGSHSNLASVANASTSSLALPQHKRGAIWTLKFSKNGKYLAAGGEDRIVRVWSVISTPAERAQCEQEQEDSSSADEGSNIHRSRRHHRKQHQRLNAPLFLPFPTREFAGHAGDVLDLSWSKNDFLLSSSMDKTVRLWHVSRQECLCCFQHEDFVTSIAFHPSDDRFFLSGSLDSELRLWSIPDKTVVYRAELPDLITAVAFSSDGQTAIAGCFTGLCLFYETVGLRYHTRMHVRSSHGKNSKGSKITGISHLEKAPESVSSDAKLLITSNDSRIRLYNMRDKSLEAKLKGNENLCSQIRATSSEDGRYVICGSEDDRVYIWDMQAKTQNPSKHPYEYFTAHNHVVTDAVFAPSTTIELLSQSGDPIFDTCTPPPVRLSLPEDDATTGTGRYPPPNPASRHPNGNIIVSADQYGTIKVFRQDCAYEKRKENEAFAATLSKTSSPAHSIASHSLRRPEGGSLYTPSPLNHSSYAGRGSSSNGRSQSTRISIDSPSRGSERSVERHRSMLSGTLSSRASRSLSRLGRSKKRNSLLSSTSPPPPREDARRSKADLNHSIDRNLLHVGDATTSTRGTPTSSNRESFSLPVSSDSDDDADRSLSVSHTGNSSTFFSDDADTEDFDRASDIEESAELRCPKCQGTNFKASITVRKETRLVCSNCGSLVV
ncbi:WD40-repeat-containing domain protein [Myxozyma melibiosi]|uniref:WD40-repeat-containing domain protein n=1 Tax=Myxozyma melibiosi TaxID=54550 RepID=A0ABR1FB25_9ASCO